ncbi:MAG: DUF6783 domain-containing protein [Ruminococcus sp.]
MCGLRKCFLIHPRECLKKAFCKVRATICGRFGQNEGAATCYDTPNYG